METLRHGICRGGLQRCGGLIEGRTHETRRRRHVARNTEKAAARTESAQLQGTEHLGGSAPRIEIDIIVEVGELPLESGRIGQHAQFVLIKDRLAVDDLQHQLTARRIRETPMHRRGTRIDTDHMHPLYGGLHLLHTRTAPQYPGHELQVGDARSLLRRIERLVPTVAGEIEQSGREPRFVQAFGHELLLFDRHSHIAVTRGKLHAVHPLRRVGALHVPPGNDHIPTVEITSAPLDGPSHDIPAVFGFQCDARAGCRPLRPYRRSGDRERGRYDPFHHSINL